MPAREQIAALLSDVKWVIFSCLAFSALLLIPDQTLELYRIIYSASPVEEPRGFIYLHLPIVLIGLSVWFAAGQVAAATRDRIAAPTQSFEFATVVLPLLLGALPLIACTLGLFDAVPTRLQTDQYATRLPGAIWEHLAEHFDDLAVRLFRGGMVQAVLAVALAAEEWWLAVRMAGVIERLNKSHFGRMSGVLCSLALIVAVTAACYVWPVALPRAVGTFGIIALFAVCILVFVINFTLLSIRYRLPLIALLCVLVVVFGLDSLNDNHTIRLIGRSDPAVLQAADAVTAKSEFAAWIEHRPDRQNYADDGDEFPVYIVAAQGGGIYAAYQTAVFLARMQDVCPAFRHHLFAISSVSGGSVGAAAFAAALDAYDHDLLELTPDEASQRAEPGGDLNSCPAITDYRTSPRVPPPPDAPGPLERAVRRALEHDFLAPLVAGALFTDYTQRFVPVAIPSFDRARSLEYALEQAGRDMMKATAAPDEVAAHNAFARSILDLWRPDRSMPALLMNATDAASGRRFVISPFRAIAAPQPGETPVALDYQFFNARLPEPDRARDIRLSTAAFVSARFPWVTPAATVTYGDTERLRLVDGGYVDNSGVETALDLNDAITDGPEGRDRGKAKPKLRLNLVVLSGGDFPVRKSFSFGDLMEPLRALLSTERSRAYVAIDRARQDFQPYSVVTDYVFNGERLNVRAGTLKMARLDNRFYRLPLGWSLSDDTREIIEGQSGRYWECLPDDNFEQAQPGLAQSDCVELLIYYELDKALTGDSRSRLGTQIAIANYLAKREKAESRTGGGENRIIDCYQHATSHTVNFEQAGNIRALIQQWRDQHPDPDEKDLLPFVLAVAAFESTDFRAREQSLSYMSVEQILKAWGTNAAFQHMSTAGIEKYVRDPVDLAEKLDGGKRGNGVGNGDAWRYRPRGLAYVRGRADYQKVADSLHLKELIDDPDLLLIPEINALSFFYFYFKADSVPALAGALRNIDWQKAQAKDARVKAALDIVQRDAQRSYSESDSSAIIENTRIFRACITAAHVMEARAAQ
jgi:predicted chitinase